MEPVSATAALLWFKAHVLHLGGVALGVKIAAGTIGGVIFVGLVNEITKDAYRSARAQGRKRLNRDEELAILDEAYRGAREALAQRGLLTDANVRDLESTYRQQLVRLT